MVDMPIVSWMVVQISDSMTPVLDGDSIIAMELDILDEDDSSFRWGGRWNFLHMQLSREKHYSLAS